MLTLGLIAFLSTSFTYIVNGPINQCYEVNDSVSTASGQTSQPEPQEEQPKADQPKEENKKSISTLSGNVLHYLIYKLKLSDILSDENESEVKDKIISMA